MSGNLGFPAPFTDTLRGLVVVNAILTWRLQTRQGTEPGFGYQQTSAELQF